MVLADEAVVRGVLSPYEAALYQSVLGAWDEWKALSLGGRLRYPARSRACLVHDFIVQQAITAFSSDPAIRVIERDETAKFVVAETVLLRFKKGDENGLGSNIRTQASMKFVEQQHELPGMPNAHKVEVIYTLNKLATKIDRLTVVARDGEVRLWDYDLAPRTTAEIIDLHIAPATETERGVRIRVRTTHDKQKSETGE
jgi:hypothetical protein